MIGKLRVESLRLPSAINLIAEQRLNPQPKVLSTNPHYNKDIEKVQYHQDFFKGQGEVLETRSIEKAILCNQKKERIGKEKI